MRAFLGIVAFFTLTGVARANNSDCTCVDWPAERRMTEADQVFLGRFVERATEGDKEALRFDVVHALKGVVGAKHVVRRGFDLECDRSFKKGELALVFVKGGRMPICAGNVDLDHVLPTFGAYLDGGATAPLDVLKVALAGRFGKVKKAWAYMPAYAGKKLQTGATQVLLVGKPADDLAVVGGTTVGPLSYVSIRRPDGIASYVLVAKEKGRLVVIAQLDRDLKLK